MSDPLTSVTPTPSKQEFAATFRLVSRISFWVQLGLGVVSILALVFAVLSRNLTTSNNNLGISIGIALAVIGILLLCLTIYIDLRYRYLAKGLQNPSLRRNPSKKDVIKLLRIGLVLSLIGLSLAFVASETTVLVVLAKALALPQGVAVYNRENAIRPLDMFVLLSNVNLVGAHLIGCISPLGLLNWVD
jgi:hypothetical protein